MTEFLECVSNFTNHCSNWKIPQEVTRWNYLEHFNTFIIGACFNVNALDDGLRCIGSKRGNVLNIFVRRNCDKSAAEWINTLKPRTEMQHYCIRMIFAIQCTVNQTRELGCSDEFYDFLLHSSYVRLPVECFESNSTKMKWHYMYTEIPKKFPERQKRTDEEEPNTCTTTDDTVSSAAWNYMSHVSIIKLNLILYLLQVVLELPLKINFLI
ncbi:unnamed protein product [Mytilus edulis]|uniref:Uncharacterized protein n=1 Tax=Mytilus edulis TaxID=6550 RepID=A0A8S3V5A6_MYTED|nr:unnamed protein product [Mytilus edulis]